MDDCIIEAYESIQSKFKKQSLKQYLSQKSARWQNDQRNIPHKMFIMQDQYVIQQQRSSTGALIMNQIISVHVGGTGVKVGLSFWDQLTRNIELNVKNEGEKMYTERFFYEKQKGYQIPRAIFLDTDCLSKNLITNTKGNFDKRLIVGGDGMSCGNNYAIGMISKQGGDLHKLFEEAVRREADRCDRVNGFIVTGAPAGGAGGGLGAGAMVKLYQIMQDSIIQNFAIYSGNWQQQQKCLAAPQIYNILLNLNRVGSQVDLMYILQNNSVQKLLSAKGILHSNFKDINEYYGQCLNQHINSYISPGFLNMDQRKRATNLVPYYSLRCICASLSTKGSSQCIESALSLRNKLMHHPTLSDSRLFSFNIHVKDNFAYEQQITNRVFSYMNRNNAQFLDWLSPSPLSISIGRSDSFKDNSAWILSNGRNNVLWLNEIGKAFKKQYRRRAFIHHYIEEGLDQTQFLQAQQSCKDLFQQYNPYELSGEVQ